MTDEQSFKPVVRIGECEDFREFPDRVQDHMGYALFVAQCGGTHRDAKTMSGFGGAGVVEVAEDLRGDTFRGVRSSRLPEEIEDRTRDAAPRYRDD
jgi:phage-related protein